MKQELINFAPYPIFLKEKLWPILKRLKPPVSIVRARAILSCETALERCSGKKPAPSAMALENLRA
jgi:hypothetical protein